VVFYSVRICCKSYQKKQLRKRLQQSNSVMLGISEYDDEKAILMDTDDASGSLLPQKKYTMDIEFEGLRFRPKKNKKPMLEGASGRFLPGKVNCVLTTERDAARALLDIFSGRSGYGYLDGEIRVNGVLESKMSSFHQLIGVVPEQDVLEQAFQLREVIRFAGHARLPYKTTFSQIAKKANVIIDLLGLTSIQYKEIGAPGKTLSLNEFQRKLVCIGMELIAEPSLLLLESKWKFFL
jgi:ABC-type multidrug transport system ATPase subunit